MIQIATKFNHLFISQLPTFPETTTTTPHHNRSTALFSGTTRVSRCQKRTSGLYGATEEISCKSVQKFLCKVAKRQTHRQNDEDISCSAAVIMENLSNLKICTKRGIRLLFHHKFYKIHFIFLVTKFIFKTSAVWLISENHRCPSSMILYCAYTKH